jgi:hypothetical protein
VNNGPQCKAHQGTTGNTTVANCQANCAAALVPEHARTMQGLWVAAAARRGQVGQLRQIQDDTLAALHSTDAGLLSICRCLCTSNIPLSTTGATAVCGWRVSQLGQAISAIAMRSAQPQHTAASWAVQTQHGTRQQMPGKPPQHLRATCCCTNMLMVADCIGIIRAFKLATAVSKGWLSSSPKSMQV